MNFTLKPYQADHVQRLLQILENHKVAIDCSATGSGKTVTSLFIARQLLATNQIGHVTIICPPTLRPAWSTYLTAEDEGTFSVLSSYSFSKTRLAPATLVIVDECHLFKNQVQRSQKLKLYLARAHKVLMMSATPFDDKRQCLHVVALFQTTSTIQDQMSRMDFEYDTKLEFECVHSILENEKEYDQGLRRTHSAYDARTAQFKPAVFGAGMRSIHNALIPVLIQYTQSLLQQCPNHKFILVLNYTHHFQQVQAAFENVLILNGNTPQTDRLRIIGQFQHPSLEHRVIAISSEVGSVGIELDDQHGQFPRHLISLPVANAINFFQSIGRIQRTLTKSPGKVSVIQPIRSKTYFKYQIARKGTILGQFREMPVFDSTIYQHIEGCPATDDQCVCRDKITKQ